MGRFMRWQIAIILCLFTFEGNGQSYSFEKNNCLLEIKRGTPIRYSMQLEDIRWVDRSNEIMVFDGVQTFRLREDQLSNFASISVLKDSLSAWREDCLTSNSLTTSVINNLIKTGTLTDQASISWDLDQINVATVTLGGNRALSNPTNKENGRTYYLIVIQDGIGSRTLSFGSDYKFPGGTSPTLTTTAGAVDIITMISDGTDMFCVFNLDFQ